MDKYMRVKKRNGNLENVSFDKITYRLQSLINILPKLDIDATIISQKMCSEIYDEIETSLLDKLTSEIIIAMLPNNIEYGILASRLVISNHHKNTKEEYEIIINELYNQEVISEGFYKLVCDNITKINEIINRRISVKIFPS